MVDKNNPLPRRVLIIGGGTAGWMAAALLAHDWGGRGVEITLMESATIGTIGVGEGSTPRLPLFFKHLGIPESEWMPQCNATYKCGVRFPDWSTRPGYESYYHPFFAADDGEFMRPFYHNVQLRNKKKLKVHAHPDAFFVSQHLAHNCRAPVSPPGLRYQTAYSYHFDGSLLGQFLGKKARSWGVKHLIDTVTQVNRSEDGSLASVDTGEHGTVEADFFVDCTGFAGLLIGRSMEVPFISYNDALFNDRAVTLPTPQVTADHGLSSETLSGAMKHGWLFKIPLTNRFGNGYVYCSAYCSAEDAEAELRDKLNLHDESIQARHLKMRVGRRERCWEKNCLAVGLSQGFIEPLEATALFLVAATVEDFVATYERGSTDAKVRATFNDKISGMFDGVRDYVFMHFKLNTRADTPYWRDCRDANACSDLVEEFLRVWDHDGDIGHVLDLLKANGQRLVYTPTSWVCMLAGMGRFPSGAKKPRANQQVVDPKVAYRHCEEFVRQFPDHRQALAALQTAA